MRALLRSELLKQRTTRTNVLLLVWMVALVVLVVAPHVASFSVDTLARPDNQLKVLGLGTSLGALFGALLGAMSITAETRHGTIRPTFLASPRRERVIAAKVATSALGGAGIGLLAEALAAGVGPPGSRRVASTSSCARASTHSCSRLGDLPGAGKFAPGASAGALAGAIQTQIASDLVAPALGALLLIAYAAAASAVGAIATVRRDVT